MALVVTEGMSPFHVSVPVLVLAEDRGDIDAPGVDTEIIIQLVTARQPIVELPIPTYYGDEICYVNGFKYDAFEHSAALVRAGELAARASLPEIRKWLQPEPERAIVKIAKPASNPAPITLSS